MGKRLSADSEGEFSERGGLSRRRFLRFLAGTSGLALFLPGLVDGMENGNEAYIAQALGAVATTTERLVPSAEKAYNVFDLKAVAKKNIPLAHWGYLETGVNGDVTLKANEAGFLDLVIRPKRLVDVSKINTKVSLFGEAWETPIILSPVSSQLAFHPDGELAVARAAKKMKHIQCLSSFASTAIEQVNEGLGRPVWFQLYPTDVWEVTKFVVARAQAAGCRILLLTVDNLSRRSDTSMFFADRDTRDCKGCHNGKKSWDRPLFVGTTTDKVSFSTPRNWDWGYLAKLRTITDMNLTFAVMNFRNCYNRYRPSSPAVFL